MEHGWCPASMGASLGRWDTFTPSAEVSYYQGLIHLRTWSCDIELKFQWSLLYLCDDFENAPSFELQDIDNLQGPHSYSILWDSYLGPYSFMWNRTAQPVSCEWSFFIFIYFLFTFFSASILFDFCSLDFCRSFTTRPSPCRLPPNTWHWQTMTPTERKVIHCRDGLCSRNNFRNYFSLIDWQWVSLLASKRGLKAPAKSLPLSVYPVLACCQSLSQALRSVNVLVPTLISSSFYKGLSLDMTGKLYACENSTNDHLISNLLLGHSFCSCTHVFLHDHLLGA